jgi:hypothetical protein
MIKNPRPMKDGTSLCIISAKIDIFYPDLFKNGCTERTRFKDYIQTHFMQISLATQGQSSSNTQKLSMMKSTIIGLDSIGKDRHNFSLSRNSSSDRDVKAPKAPSKDTFLR